MRKHLKCSEEPFQQLQNLPVVTGVPSIAATAEGLPYWFSLFPLPLTMEHAILRTRRVRVLDSCPFPLLPPSSLPAYQT